MKIYHTADIHIGLRFGTYDANVRSILIEERYAVLQRMVHSANANQCDVFVVAGDLFDHDRVADKDVRRAVDILASFTGHAVLLLAGNHDNCSDRSAKPWSTVIAHANNTSIYPLLSDEVLRFDINGEVVNFYACPCPDHTSKDHRIGWVAEHPKSSAELHIGIAHGNVVGHSLDDNHAYYSMTEEELKASGVKTWLLGHIHVPFPLPGTVGTPTFFMPGAPTPGSVRMRHPGQAWVITIDKDGEASYQADVQAGITFKRFTVAFSQSSDLQSLQHQVQLLPPSTTILDLQLSGMLVAQDLATLSTWLDDLTRTMLHVRYESTVKEQLTAEMIASKYPTGTLQERVLTDLLADADHPLDVHLAYEILQGGGR
ncbi:MAG: hypothetical protein FGM24_07080 [Candidatus Kapabacteria bacterium]|nr:hypothetical protein [Candidatus Kapabacteria bacterium]